MANRIWIFSIFVAILIKINCTYCENILYLSTVPSPSHEIWNRVLAKGLQKQHNVTFLSTEPPRNLGANVYTIFMEEVPNELLNELTPADYIEYSDVNPFDEFIVFNKYCTSSCSGSFKSKGLQFLLNYPKDFKFDLIIYDYACGPCFLFLLDRFNYPPMVGVTAFGNPPYTTELMGGHNYYAYVPYYGLLYNSDMTFWQRTYNFIVHLANIRNYRNILSHDQDSIVRKYYKSGIPHLLELNHHTSIALVNAHPAVDFAEPSAPSVIGVGGLQIEPPKSLPKDLEEFIQKSPKGAVLFSLGTNVRSDDLGAEKQLQFLRAFEQLPDYHFLWKFETDNLPMALPKNVIIRTFLPQTDILAHPNTKAFMSHTGMLSTHESIWYGVPILAVPFLCDQHRTSHNLARDGLAKIVDHEKVTTAELKDKLRIILETPFYQTNMKKRSQQFRDQPEKPLDRAVWWINWVLRNPNAEHLQSPVKKLGYFRGNIYDILLVFGGIIFVIFAGILKLICYFCKSKKQAEKQKRQ